MEGHPSLDAATEALRSGEWHAACDLYREALGDGGAGGEIHFGLGVARSWLGDTDEALRCWERAYVAFEAAADQAQAVLVALDRAGRVDRAFARSYFRAAARIVNAP